jgi:hypothetical protein
MDNERQQRALLIAKYEGMEFDGPEWYDGTGQGFTVENTTKLFSSFNGLMEIVFALNRSGIDDTWITIDPNGWVNLSCYIYGSSIHEYFNFKTDNDIDNLQSAIIKYHELKKEGG